MTASGSGYFTNWENPTKKNRKVECRVRVHLVLDMLLHKCFHACCQIHGGFLHRVVSCIGDNLKL